MGFLIAAILCSFSIALLVKGNEVRGLRTEVVLASNYFSAVVISWGMLLLAEGGIETVRTVSRTTLLLGFGGSLLWPGAFFLMMWGIRRFGVSLAGSAARLSLTVPVLFAMVFLQERLTLGTSLGIGVALGAIVLLSPLGAASGATEPYNGSLPGERSPSRRIFWFFPVLVLVFGIVDLWVNLYNTVAPGSEKGLFVALIFTGAMVWAWLVIALRRLRVDRVSVVRGLLLGIPNVFSTIFLMESLRAPLFAGLSAVVYTLYSATGVLLAFSAGAIFWKERLSGRNRAGMVLAIVSIALLNLRG